MQRGAPACGGDWSLGKRLYLPVLSTDSSQNWAAWLEPVLRRAGCVVTPVRRCSFYLASTILTLIG